MTGNRTVRLLILALALLGLTSQVRARDEFIRQPNEPQASAMAVQNVGHDVGKLVLTVSNRGLFGIYDGGTNFVTDYCTGGSTPACEYPKGSSTRYLFTGSFWIGAVVGRDTLVSTGADGWNPGFHELQPDEIGLGEPECKSIKDPTDADAYEGAISEQDIIATYTDTIHRTVTYPTDNLDARPHTPLGIEITQRSFAWSYEYAEDFVLFDYSIKNIGGRFLSDVFMGVYVDADVYPTSQDGQTGSSDDICGFVYDLPTPADFSGGCEGYRDTVFIAWIADNDGEPNVATNQYEASSPINVTATRIIRTPVKDSLDVSFNWWISNGDASQDFGPQKKGQVRLLGNNNLGTPVGDRSKYFLLSNGEFDYDQAFTAVIGQDPNSEWLNPGPNAGNYADGYDTRYLLSFGPFDIEPDQVLPVSFAYIGGEGFHTDPKAAGQDLPFAPGTYYSKLDFADLGLNSTWASWIYDNPGVDSDGDNNFGKYRICVSDSVIDSIVDGHVYVTYLRADTIYYEGDGVPDFRGASPPPPPDIWIYPSVQNGVGQMRLRWNGGRTETARDVFSNEKDFEGYRVYLARDSRASSYSLVESYDREDFNKWVYNPDLRPEPGYVLKESPYSLTQLRGDYGGGDPDWDPLQYSASSPLFVDHPGTEDDSTIYFAAQDFNASVFGENTRISRTYVDTLVYPRPPDTLVNWVPNKIPVDYPDSLRTKYFTDDGYLKYYEYEFTFENLLPTVLYYVAVTTFDYGSPGKGLGSLESSVTYNPASAYPLPDSKEVADSSLKVYVYPNPYRADGLYKEQGFEGRDVNNPANDRIRRVHFANLPAVCTIKIFTLDGDLVREIEHLGDINDPKASHETWDLITRNTQSVVSGIYYWTVESSGQETQIGKLIIIL